MSSPEFLTLTVYPVRRDGQAHEDWRTRDGRPGIVARFEAHRERQLLHLARHLVLAGELAQDRMGTQAGILRDEELVERDLNPLADQGAISGHRRDAHDLAGLGTVRDEAEDHAGALVGTAQE
jgi:hypothetical protein